jgi:hypothetical protein
MYRPCYAWLVHSIWRTVIHLTQRAKRLSFAQPRVSLWLQPGSHGLGEERWLRDHHAWLQPRATGEVVAIKEKLKALKAVNSNDKKIEVLEARIQEQDKDAREAEAKADALDVAVFDLKAVNPNAVVRIDARTPEEVILSIGDQVEIAAQALKTLRALLQA